MNEKIKAQINAYLDRHWAEILAELRALVEIPSVGRPGEDGFPYGRACAQVLDYALDLSRRKGLAPRNHGNWYGTATWGQGSRHVGIFTHLDGMAGCSRPTAVQRRTAGSLAGEWATINWPPWLASMPLAPYGN